MLFFNLIDLYVVRISVRGYSHYGILYFMVKDINPKTPGKCKFYD